MGGKTHFLLIDTETTIQDHVVDFGAIICDRKGNIKHSCKVLIAEYWNKEELFYDVSAKDTIWSRRGLEKRKENYHYMLQHDERRIATVNAVNVWLMKVLQLYKTSPILTAYNIAFDLDKCKKSGILLEGFERKFCLWHTAAAKYAHSKEYRQFVLNGHYFNPPTRHSNMSFKTNAEIMARFILDQPNLEDEPHTAYEDAKYYELPILVDLASKMTEDQLINDALRKGYNWQDYQVKDWFAPK